MIGCYTDYCENVNQSGRHNRLLKNEVILTVYSS